MKTVSAFANYGGGTIVFGVDDNGKVVGIEDLDQKCLDIENKINDSTGPRIRVVPNEAGDNTLIIE